MAGYLGYVPGALPPAPAPTLAPPSEADIRDLYRDLDLDPRALLGASPSPAAASAVHLAVNLQARSPSALAVFSFDVLFFLRCYAMWPCGVCATGGSQEPAPGPCQEGAALQEGCVRARDLTHCLLALFLLPQAPLVAGTLLEDGAIRLQCRLSGFGIATQAHGLSPQVAVLVGTLLDGACEPVVALEGGGLGASLRLAPGRMEAEAAAQELALQDLCSREGGAAEPLLQRWLPGARRSFSSLFCIAPHCFHGVGNLPQCKVAVSKDPKRCRHAYSCMGAECLICNCRHPAAAPYASARLT